MLILDTNVVSVMMQPISAPGVMKWLDRQPVISIWTTTITVFEIRAGISRLSPGKKRAALEIAFRRVWEEGLGGRVLTFDMEAALAAGEIEARLRSASRTIDARDSQIAGIAMAMRGTVVTRNLRHFQEAGIHVIDPWAS